MTEKTCIDTSVYSFSSRGAIRLLLIASDSSTYPCKRMQLDLAVAEHWWLLMYLPMSV